MSSLQVITASAKDWIAALTRLSPAMAGKKSMAILYCVHIDPSSAILSGYDFETSAVTTLAESSGEGAPFLVTYRWLVDAIRTTTGKAKAAPVTVSVDGEKVTVSACGYELHAETMPVVDYPEIPQVNPDASAKLPAADLRAALRRASIAASTDETLPILNGVQVTLSSGAMELLATDRYRLAEDHVSGEGDGSSVFVLGIRAVKALDRFLTGGEVMIGKGESRIIIKTDAATFTVMGTDGTYPKIKTLFPETVTASFEFNRVALLESARVAEKMNERYSPCIVRISTSGAEVTFNYGLLGPSSAPIAAGGAVHGSDDEIQIAMNPKYLVEALQQIPADKVRISYTTLPKPFLFTPAGLEINDPESLKYLIMPVRMPS